MINRYDNLTTYRPDTAPVRHKRKVPFNPCVEISPKFASRMQKIRELDQELGRFILKEKDYFDLVLDAYSSNIHWSTKIEGNPLGEDEVRRLSRATLAGERTENPGGPAQEIINHIGVLIFSGLFSGLWNKETICYLQQYLLQGTGTKANLGSYRTRECCVEENGEEVFIACPPSSIAEEMESLLEWVRTRAPAYEPIVAATILFHEFESIHPFEDGNGRTGRTLFHLYLMGHGLPNSHLCKIDYEVLKDTSLYYDLLAYTDEKGTYGPLVEMFSVAVLRSYEETRDALSRKDLLSSGLDEVSKRIIMMARERSDWFDLSEAMTWADGLGEQTVRNRLSNLVELDVLEKRGRTRSCAYRFRNPFADIKTKIGADLSVALDPESLKRVPGSG